MPDILSLGFDTSAAHCAAALLTPEGAVFARVEEMAKGQAERLVPLLEELLAEAGIAWADVSGLGVGIGPGNFTGVRIAVSLARGLALGLSVPAIGVSLFDARAYGVARPCVVIEDAKRGEVYVQGFEMEPRAPVLIACDRAPDQPSARSATPLAEAIARLALARMHAPCARPAPLYLRAADAAPPADPPPLILP